MAPIWSARQRLGSSLRTWLGAASFVLLIAGCVGDIGDGDDGGGTTTLPPGVPPEETQAEIAVSGLRRLSIAEYRQTIADLLGMDPAGASELLPGDTLAPFDNDYTLQTPSESLIKGAEMLANDVSQTVMSDAALRVSVVGCEPTAATDDACFRTFVEQFGKRALRRPLSETEIDRVAGLATLGTEAEDFWVGARAALSAFLQHPEFLYRVEIGEPVEGEAGIYRLNEFELAARLSYFLLGSTTPDWLIDSAEHGELATKEGVTAAVGELLADERARARFNRFHAMWLSYEQLSRDGIFGQMHAETNALIEKIVFEEGRPWIDILTSESTYLTPELAEHYGMSPPDGDAGWVTYDDPDRKGLLSHGTFLSAVPKFGDTSPTQRGLLVRARLFCQPIGPPPANLNVNVDQPPESADPDACKHERYNMSQQDSCKGCHQLMDPIGFGLENYDTTGRYRDYEPGRPECAIDGDGEFVGVGTFSGPGELADRAIESGLVESCVAEQLYRFAVGRTALDESDRALLERVTAEASGAEGLRLDTLIQQYVTSESFRFRREETMQ